MALHRAGWIPRWGCAICHAEMKQESREVLAAWLWERPCLQDAPDLMLTALCTYNFLQKPQKWDMGVPEGAGVILTEIERVCWQKDGWQSPVPQWSVEDEKYFSPSLNGTFCLAHASVLLNIAAGARPGAQIRASSTVSWVRQAKGGWLDVRLDGIPLSSQEIHRADHT